jgi:CRISPR-associated endonuclease/helicase Cas3
LNIPYSDNLSGKNVWDKYVDIIIQKQKEDFIKNKIKMNKIQSLISLFTFSIYTYSSDYKILCTYSRNGREEYGYLYLESYAEIFTFEDGINTSLLSESNFL